ncbi:MAG: RluA family pseudouridine synthase [Clostridioides sp.]|nr:RluA family pseudouridine synthase [Clostridioides sp.]
MNFEVEINGAGKRLDVYLSEIFADFSRSAIQKIIKNGKVHVNGKIEKPRTELKIGDNLEIEIAETPEIEIIPQDIPLDIVYEDEDILIVNKKQGMVVHPGAGNYEGTLVNALLHYTGGKLSNLNDDRLRPGIVHRIDKDTSGLLLVAKTNEAHKGLAEQLKMHMVKREYRFICHGVIEEDKVTVDRPIARNPKDRLKMSVLEGGREAVTHFEVLERFEKYTYMKARLETGRTHQIRVHSTYIGHPLMGDPIYGKKNEKFKLSGQVLHAKTLGFIHPISKEYMEFDSELPDSFKGLIEKLRVSR